jgi:6-phosphogluconolactonase
MMAATDTWRMSVATAESDGRSGAVFIMSSAASKNEIIAYERSSNGSLRISQRYDTLGKGSSGINDPLGSQGSLTLSQDHSVLFAVNAGSGDVSLFSVSDSTEFPPYTLPSFLFGE